MGWNSTSTTVITKIVQMLYILLFLNNFANSDLVPSQFYFLSKYGTNSIDVLTLCAEVDGCYLSGHFHGLVEQHFYFIQTV